MSTEKMPEEAIRIFNDAGTHCRAILESVRELREGDRGLYITIRDHHEMPMRLHLTDQHAYVSNLIESAQAYRRDLLRLLNLEEEE